MEARQKNQGLSYGFQNKKPKRRIQVLEYLASAQDPRTMREICRDLGISIDAHPSKMLQELVMNETLKKLPKTCSVTGQMASGYFIFRDEVPHQVWPVARLLVLKKNLENLMNDNDQEMACRAGQNAVVREVLGVIERKVKQ